MPVDSRRILWIVLANSLLWTAGNGLTTGGFLNYFALELGASASLLGLIAATPETVGVSGIGFRWLLRWGAQRKRLFLVTSLASRSCSLLIPLLAFHFPGESAWSRAEWLWGCIAVASVFQGVASVAFHTWLADAVPSAEWGRLFAWRNITVVAVQMVVPLTGALLRDYWREHLPNDQILMSYSAVFVVGLALQFSALLPLWRLPDIPAQIDTRRPDWSVIRGLWRQPETRWLLLHAWCLAAANGLTQAVFFKYQKDVLHVSLSRYYLLTDLMWAMQILTSWLAGSGSVRWGHKPALFWGTLLASFAMPFWCVATAETWWLLLGAFFCWGAFGAVNVAGPNLMLGFAPRGDSGLHLAMFRQMAGLLAGVTGILGGVWLDHLLRSNWSWPLTGTWTLGAFHVIFLTSWLGRVIAALCVIPAREPDAATKIQRKTRSSDRVFDRA